jgi:hypothetical protein
MQPTGPIHGQFCRCPECKPPLVGAVANAAAIKFGMLLLAIVSGIAAAIIIH